MIRNPSQVGALGDVDLITVTGGVGYIGEQTFRTVVKAAGDEPPWVAALSLRWIDYEPIANVLEEFGLVTELVEGYTAPQRRFADHDDERDAALAGLRRHNIDPAPELALDGHCAKLYVANLTDTTELSSGIR